MADYRKIQADATAVSLENVGSLNNSLTVTESTTLTVAQSGSDIYVGTDALVQTLPLMSAGLEYTFINSGADGAVLLLVEPSDGSIYGTIANAAADSVLASASNVGNTKATAIRGNWIKLSTDGTAWYAVGGVGIWAEV